MRQKYLSYFWDYPITKKKLKKIIKEEESQRIWAISRLLESAPFEEIWQYLTLKELKKIFPYLKLKKSIKIAWQRALKIWS